MSSWLNIGGNLSSLATNVKSFTHEVLTEAKNESYSQMDYDKETVDGDEQGEYTGSQFELSHKVTLLQDEINLLNTELSSKDDQVYYLQKECNRLQDDHQKHTENLQRDLLEKETEIDQFSVKLQEMENNFTSKMNELASQHEEILAALVEEKKKLESQINGQNQSDSSWNDSWGGEKVDNAELEKIKSENDSLSNEVMMKEIILNSIETKMNELSKEKVDVADFSTWIDEIMHSQQNHAADSNQEIVEILTQNMDKNFNPKNPSHVKQWISELNNLNSMYQVKISDLENVITSVENEMSKSGEKSYTVNEFQDWLQTVNNSEKHENGTFNSANLLAQIETEIRESDEDYENFEISQFADWFAKMQSQIDELEVELLTEQETREKEEQQRIEERAKLNELFTEKQNEIAMLKVELYNKTSSPVPSSTGLSDAVADVSHLHEQLGETNARCQGLQDELTSLQRRNDELNTSQEELAEAMNKVEKAQEEVKELITEKNSLSDQLTSANKKIELVEKELSFEQEDNNKTREELNDVKMKQQELIDQLSHLQSQYNLLQQQFYDSHHDGSQVYTLQMQLAESTKKYEMLYQQYLELNESNNEFNDELTEKNSTVEYLLEDIRLTENALRNLSSASCELDVSLGKSEYSSSFLVVVQEVLQSYNLLLQSNEELKKEVSQFQASQSEQVEQLVFATTETSKAMIILQYYTKALNQLNLDEVSHELVDSREDASIDESFYHSYIDSVVASLQSIIEKKNDLEEKNNKLEASIVGKSEENIPVEEACNAVIEQGVNADNPDNWDDFDNWDSEATDTIEAVGTAGIESVSSNDSELSQLKEQLAESIKQAESYKDEITKCEVEIEELHANIDDLEKTLKESRKSAKNSQPSEGGGLKFGALKKKMQELEVLNEGLVKENEEIRAIKVNNDSLVRQVPNNGFDIIFMIAKVLDQLSINDDEKLVYDNNLVYQDLTHYSSYMQSFQEKINNMQQAFEDQKIIAEAKQVQGNEVEYIAQQNSINEQNSSKIQSVNDEIIAQLKQELSQSKILIDQLTTLKATSENEIENLQSAILTLQKNKEEMADMAVKEQSPPSTAGGMKFGALKRKVQELEALNDALARENGELKKGDVNVNKTSDVSHNGDQAQNLSKLLEDKTVECQYYFQESEQLKATLLSLQNDMQTIQTECYQLKVMLHDQQNQQTNQVPYSVDPNASAMNHQDQLHNLSLRLTERSEECQQLTQQCDYLNAKVVELQNDTMDLELVRGECKQLKAMLTGKEHESRVDETISMLQAESKQLKQILMQKDQEYQQLQNSLVEKENELSDMELVREECKQLKSMLLTKGSMNQELGEDDSYQQLEVSLREKEEELQQKNSMLIEMEHKISDMDLMQEQCENLKQMLKSRGSIVSQFGDQNLPADSHNDLTKQLHEKDFLIREKDALIAEMQNSESEMKHMREEFNLLKSKESILSNESMNASAMNMDNSFLAQVQQLEEFLRGKDEEIKQKDIELHQKGQLISSLQDAASNVEPLQIECETLKEMIVEKENTFTELQKDLDVANDALQQKNDELKLKSGEHVQLEQRLNETLSVVNEKQRDIDTLQEELTESMAQDENIHMLQTEYRHVEEQLLATEKELNECKERLFASETHCERLRVYEEQYETLKALLKEKEETLNSLQLQSSESSILESETVSLLRQELDQLKTLLYERENQIGDLMSTLEKKNLELQNMYNESNQTIATLQSQLNASRVRIEELNNEYKSLDLLAQERLQTELNLQEELSNVKSQFTNASQNNFRSNDEIEHLKTAIANEQDRCQTLENDLSIKISELRNKEQTLQKMQSQLETCELKIAEYQTMNSNQANEMAKKQEEILDLQIRLENIASKPELATENLVSSESNAFSSQIESCESCKQFEKERSEIENLMTDLKKNLVNNTVYGTVVTDLREIVYAVDCLTREHRNLKEKYNSLTESCENLQERLDSQLSEHNESFSKTTEDYEFQIKDLQSQLMELSEIEVEYKNMRSESELLKNQINAAQQNNDQIGYQLHEEQMRHKQSAELVTNLQIQLAQLQEEYDKRIKESETTANTVVTAECERLRQELERNSHAYLAKNKECDQLKLDILQLEEKVHNYQLLDVKMKSREEEMEKLKKLEIENESLHSSLEDYQAKLESGKKEKAFIEELVKVKENLEQKNEELSFQCNQFAQHAQEQDVLLKHKDVNYREMEAKATRELERLRNHLMMMEENHTKDIIELQERETSLQQHLDDSKSSLTKKEVILEDSSKQFQDHVVNLEEQLHALASQRDSHTLELSKYQEKVNTDARAIYNLQSALEQLQKDKTEQYDYLTSISKRKAQELEERIQELEQDREQAQATMLEASLAVKGIDTMKLELQQKDNELKVVKDKTNELIALLREKETQWNKLIEASDNKLDKSLIRNLLLKYFQSPEDKRADIIQVIGGLLGLTHEEIEKVGTGAVPSKVTGWISNVWGFATPKKPPAPPTTPVRKYDANQSFSELFVKFLQNESETQQVPINTASLTVNNDTTTASNIKMFTPATPDILAFHNQRNEAASVEQHSRIPAPGQEIPRVHTHQAQSTLKTLLAS